jgi:hypothetical protein
MRLHDAMEFQDTYRHTVECTTCLSRVYTFILRTYFQKGTCWSKLENRNKNAKTSQTKHLMIWEGSVTPPIKETVD